MSEGDCTTGPKPDQTLMFAEAGEASSVVAKALDTNKGSIERLVRLLRARRPRAVVTAARGSSDNAATYARYLIETKLGVLTSSAAPSIASVYSATPDLSETVVLAISQSGRSPDILAIAEAARKSGAPVVAMVNDETSPLADMADVFLPLCAGAERSVAATKTYLSSTALIAQMIAAWSGDDLLGSAVHSLPGLMQRAWQCDWSAALSVLVEANDLYVVGRGVGFGAAQEAALKFKETCGLHAEAFSAAEVRHGPMALVGNGFPTFILAQDDATKSGVKELADSFFANSAKLVLAGLSDSRAITLPVLNAHSVIQPILLLQSFYKFAASLACARGRNPDTPPFLNKVTETV